MPFLHIYTREKSIIEYVDLAIWDFDKGNVIYVHLLDITKDKLALGIGDSVIEHMIIEPNKRITKLAPFRSCINGKIIDIRRMSNAHDMIDGIWTMEFQFEEISVIREQSIYNNHLHQRVQDRLLLMIG